MNDKRKERVKELYINTLCEMIREKGMSAVTIRSISDEVGYNSATLYSYFESLPGLILCAQLRFEEELLSVLQKELEKQQVESYYEIWPHMYAVMADYYLTNPNIFDCMFVTDLPENKKDELRESRGKQSLLQQYVSEGLVRISKEIHKPMAVLVKINMICLAQVTGMVLLYSKARLDMKPIMDLKGFEEMIRQIITALKEEKQDE